MLLRKWKKVLRVITRNVITTGNLNNSLMFYTVQFLLHLLYSFLIWIIFKYTKSQFS